MIKPLILAGGHGSRLWPLSRESYPKQLLKLAGEKSLLQETLCRAKKITKEEPIIVTNDTYRFLIQSQVQEINQHAQIILEPFGKNTAPAIAIAALMHIEENPLFLVMPSDHLIESQDVFEQAIQSAIPLAEGGKFITFGIHPDKAETGYGYIKPGDPLDQGFTVGEFIEKPHASLAAEFVEAGYFWNSGMFMFHARAYLEVLSLYHPKILESCEKVVSHLSYDLDFVRIDPEYFAICPSESIDYAVMEKTPQAAVVPLRTLWTDLGSWTSLHEALPSDENNNVIKGSVQTRRVKNCYLHSDGRLIAAIGIEDQIVVETEDAILISHKDHAQEVKTLVSELKGQSLVQSHSTVHRPWGSYKSVDSGERFQVKRIVVKPGAKLSLQLHHHRSEHWTVVRGTALVTKGEEEFTLGENQSTYIPLGTVHRLENPGKIDLEMIEVQTGSYLGEDDIVRLEDDYGREASKREIGF